MALSGAPMFSFQGPEGTGRAQCPQESDGKETVLRMSAGLGAEAPPRQAGGSTGKRAHSRASGEPGARREVWVVTALNWLVPPRTQWAGIGIGRKAGAPGAQLGGEGETDPLDAGGRCPLDAGEAELCLFAGCRLPPRWSQGRVRASRAFVGRRGLSERGEKTRGREEGLGGRTDPPPLSLRV